MSLARDPGISWLSSPTVCSMPVLSLMAPNENQLQGSLSQRNKQFLSFFRHSAGGMQHTAAIVGGGGGGMLARSALGRHWGRWEFGGCGCRDTTAEFFLGRSAGALLIHPSGSERGKLARSKTWAVYQCNLRSSWCFHSLLLVLCAQADANTHTCVAFVKHAEIDLANSR